MTQYSHPFDLAALLQKANRDLDDFDVDGTDIFIYMQNRLKEHAPVTLTCITAGGSNVPALHDHGLEVKDYFLTLGEDHYTFRGLDSLDRLKEETSEQVFSLYMDEQCDPGETYLNVSYEVKYPYASNVGQEARDRLDHLIDQVISEFQHMRLSEKTAATPSHRKGHRL